MTGKLPGASASDPTHWDYMHSMFGTDVSLTLIYSYAHEWTYKTLTNMFGKKKDEIPNMEVDAKEAELIAPIQSKKNTGLAHG